MIEMTQEVLEVPEKPVYELVNEVRSPEGAVSFVPFRDRTTTDPLEAESWKPEYLELLKPLTTVTPRLTVRVKPDEN